MFLGHAIVGQCGHLEVRDQALDALDAGIDRVTGTLRECGEHLADAVERERLGDRGGDGVGLANEPAVAFTAEEATELLLIDGHAAQSN